MAFVIRFLSGADDDGPGDRDDWSVDGMLDRFLFVLIVRRWKLAD